MYRIVVIANPAASQFTGGAHREVMGILSREAQTDAVWPGSATAATDAAAQAAAEGADVIVAMGGDGMVHHTLQGIVGTDSSLAIVPAGTTNVAARWLGIPSKPARAARLIVSDGITEEIGLVKVTLERGATSTTHYSIFATGFGLDAAIVEEADKDPYRKYRFGSVHYARTALGVGLRKFPGRQPHVTIKSGEQVAHGVAGVIQFREVYTYFGRMELKISEAPPDPMTVLVVERLPRRRTPAIVGRIFWKRDLGSIAGIETWEGIESLQMNADPAVEVQADGEYLGLAGGGSFTWEPAALRVVKPPVS